MLLSTSVMLVQPPFEGGSHRKPGSTVSTVAELPELRVSDEDRERTAVLLRDHYASGRLTYDELSQRLDAAYAARTRGALDATLADLPGRKALLRPRERSRRRLIANVTRYVLVNALLVVIWIVTTGVHTGFRFVTFWPIWSIIGWGFVIALQAASYLTREDGQESEGPRQLPG